MQLISPYFQFGEPESKTPVYYYDRCVIHLFFILNFSKIFATDSDDI